MTSIKTIVIAGLLSMMAAAPALAQEAIQEPGAFAFFYPNLDVLNGGAPTPAYALEGQPPSVLQTYNERDAGMAGPQIWHPGWHHVRHHRRVRHTARTRHDERSHG